MIEEDWFLSFCKTGQPGFFYICFIFSLI